MFKAVLHKGTPGEVLVAVKTTKTNSTEKDKADFMKEMVVMSTLLHPNIVRLYGLVNESESRYRCSYLWFRMMSPACVKTFIIRPRFVFNCIGVPP